jgi:hypothetical protein
MILNMKQMINGLNNPKYEKLKNDISDHYGDVIVGMVDISNLRSECKSNDEIADIVSEYFDSSSLTEQKPTTDHLSLDMLPEAIRELGKNTETGDHLPKVTEDQAKEYMIKCLESGRDYGHKPVLSIRRAAEVWENFVSFFEESKIFYEINLGDHEKWVFNNGVLIIDQNKAGVLNISQDD